MYVSITNTEGVMAILMISRSGDGHIGFFLNAIGRIFGHPPENVVLDYYELISIDRKICTTIPLKVLFPPDYYDMREVVAAVISTPLCM